MCKAISIRGFIIDYDLYNYNGGGENAKTNSVY